MGVVAVIVKYSHRILVSKSMHLFRAYKCALYTVVFIIIILAINLFV